jgi:K+-H+ exchange-related protein
MDVFVIPIGDDRYELYCEPSVDQETVDEVPPTGLFGRLRYQFGVMLRAAEERQHRQPHSDTAEPGRKVGAYRALQDRALRWVAQRIAEQRLLWNLRRETSAVAVHPPDVTFAEMFTLIRRTLQRDYDRHRVWLVIDGVLLILSGLLTLVPGPNLVAYYFAFRVVGHWLSMRGASQGLHRVTWSGRPCPPLTELRDVVRLEAPAREARVHDIASRLRLPHLSTFVERVAVRHA